MANGDALIVLMMAISKQKDSDMTEPKPEKWEEFVHPASCGVMSEDPYGTGQFSGRRKKF